MGTRYYYYYYYYYYLTNLGQALHLLHRQESHHLSLCEDLSHTLKKTEIMSAVI